MPEAVRLSEPASVPEMLPAVMLLEVVPIAKLYALLLSEARLPLIASVPPEVGVNVPPTEATLPVMLSVPPSVPAIPVIPPVAVRYAPVPVRVRPAARVVIALVTVSALELVSLRVSVPLLLSDRAPIVWARSS